MGDVMGNMMGSAVGGFVYLNMILGFIKSILEVAFYALAIALSFKGLKALDVYLNINSK